MGNFLISQQEKTEILSSILDKIEKHMFPQYAAPDRRELFIHLEMSVKICGL